MRFVTRFTICAALVALTAASATAQSGPVYFTGTGHWYQIVPNPELACWTACGDSAQKLGGYLATVRTTAERDFILDAMPHLASDSESFIGGYQPVPNGPWAWVTGEPWDTVFWNVLTGEPNNGGGVEDYVSMFTEDWTGPTGNHFPRGTWNDVPHCPPGTGPRSFIVEYDSFCDEFDGPSINTAMWDSISGDWVQSGGRITGYWPEGDPDGEQANLILKQQSMPTGDYTFDVDMVRHDSWWGNRIMLYHSPGNRYVITLDDHNRCAGVAVKTDGGPYRPANCGNCDITYFDTTPSAINRARVVRSGNTFTAYINGHEYFTLVDTIWNGNLRIGLGAFGPATYERVCINPGAPPQHNPRVMLYTTRGTGSGNGSRGFHYNEQLSTVLEARGYSLTTHDRSTLPTLSPTVLNHYDQLWLVSTETAQILDASEVQAIQDFHNAGKGVMFVGDAIEYDGPANQVSSALGLNVQYVSTTCGECDHCGGAIGCSVSTQGLVPHEVWNCVHWIQSNLNEGDLSATSPAEIIATHNGINMTALRDADGGRVAWDATWYRFSNGTAHPNLSIVHNDNAQYATNLATWLFGGVLPECSCPCHGDPVCDAVTNVQDVVATVNVAFRGGAPVFDPCCPREQTDVNCDGVTTLQDVVKMVNVAFRGADPATEFCKPCL